MKTLLACMTAVSALSVTAAASAEDGSTSLTLDTAFAVLETGAPAPQYDPVCQAKYGGRDIVVTTHWHIDPSTLIMYAEANVNPPNADVHLFPLGISGIYAFMSDGVPPQLAEEDIIRVLFSLNTEFGDAEADLAL